jgi:hypothetical protein
MKNEYLAIHKAGLILQIDAPDLAMDRTLFYRDKSDADFIKRARRSGHRWIPETIGASCPLGSGTLFASLPRGNPFADARVRDGFAAIERCERFGDAAAACHSLVSR